MNISMKKKYVPLNENIILHYKTVQLSNYLFIHKVQCKIYFEYRTKFKCSGIPYFLNLLFLPLNP